MKKLVTAIFLSIGLLGASASYADNSSEIKIYSSTKMGEIEYLFTEDVEKSAQADGSNFQSAIRLVGFDLISTLAKAGKEVNSLNAFLINKITTGKQNSFQILGVFVGNTFIPFNRDSKSQELENVLNAFSRNSLMVVWLKDRYGAEVMLAQK